LPTDFCNIKPDDILESQKLPFWSDWIGDNLKRGSTMGDKGKKDKDKARKQKTTKQDQEVKRKLEKQPKKTS
jgi:hypothetical protein